MATLTNINKSSATLTNINKSGATLTNINKSSQTGYITTDDLSFILVGGNEDEVLIWNIANALTNITKN